ncbi:MAG: hypothetical protein LQ347_001477 [Umbilicaria vellea]|nr:MAG: hypothetical protein LQ347_001477 [Umbilicaria vellea]
MATGVEYPLMRGLRTIIFALGMHDPGTGLNSPAILAADALVRELEPKVKELLEYVDGPDGPLYEVYQLFKPPLRYIRRIRAHSSQFPPFRATKDLHRFPSKNHSPFLGTLHRIMSGLRINTRRKDRNRQHGATSRLCGTAGQRVYPTYLALLFGGPSVYGDANNTPVHGLNPINTEFHAEATWTVKGKLWLRDFLPPQLPSARVLLFGYNANVAFETSIAGVREQAINLLNRVASKRGEAEERPIVFIAHSLGGLVVKRALVEAKLDDSYKSIREATYGIAFFSTPHQGGNFTKLGDIAASITRGVLRNPSNTFMEALKKDSLFSDTLVGDFRHQLEDYHVLSFFETLPMGRLGLIVDQKSATLGLAGLRERQIPMDADHIGVCKFESAEGDDYEQVSFNLVRLVRSAVKAAAERARLALLSVPSSQALSDAACLDKEKTLFLVPFGQDNQFVGREDIISNIDGKLETEQRVALTGIGGVGKSQIAIEYCYRYRSKNPNRSIFWVHASTFERFDQAYKDIARRLKLPKWDDPKTNTLQIVSDWLTDEDHPEWLIVLDNADDADMFQNPPKGTCKGTAIDHYALPLCRYLPQTKGSILVTSRNKQAAFGLINRSEHIIDVLPMEEESAQILLRRRLPDDKSSEDDSIALVETLERLPLAITQAAAYISVRKTRMTIAKYLAYARQNEKILLADIGDLRRDPSMPNSVLLTWHISFDQIRESSPPAAELLSLMSVLDRQGIPEFLLRKGDNSLDFEDALAPLNDFALISSEADGKCFGMHRLVQLATREWLHRHGEVTKWEKEAVTLLSESFPTGGPETWKICVALLPHAEKVLNYQYSEQQYSLQQTEVLYRTAWYLRAQGRYDLALDRSQEALNTRRQVLNEEDLRVILSLGLTAMVLTSQGKYKEAEAMNRQTLTLHEKVLGIKHPSTLTSMGNLALVLYRQGNYEEAETINRQILTLREKVLGAEHPSTLTSMSNLASVLDRQGKYEEAETMNRQTLTLSKKVLRMEHPDTLTSMSNLALVLNMQGKYEEAETINQQTLTLREKVLGTEHPSTLTSMSNLALVLNSQGKYEEAEAMNRQILTLREKVLGTEHPDTLLSVWWLAHLLQSQKRYQDAYALYQRASMGYQEVLGPSHPYTLACLEDHESLLESMKQQRLIEEMETHQSGSPAAPRGRRRVEENLSDSEIFPRARTE